MAREDLHFRLRIPEELKAKVEDSALDNHRSMTAEIIARLESSFRRTKDEELDDRMHELAAELKQDMRMFWYSRFVLEEVVAKNGQVSETAVNMAHQILEDFAVYDRSKSKWPPD